MLKPGMFISDRYEIIDKVGSGGMADVYKAKDQRLNRFVAIKVLKPEYSSDKSFVNKFRGEAQSAAGLSHPNIVNVYDVGDDSGLHFIVMELVEGITLKRFIERKGKLEVKEAVGIAIQIAQGMEAAHDNHIIHRDIKPQNIIISRDGKVKVTDFGIAKATNSNTITSNAMGSVHYLSPEQARGGYSDEKSDIYSLGVTLYEMLSGKVPFAGDNTVSVALLHIQGEAMPLRELDPEIPVSVDKIVQKCMQKRPERRYHSASELIADLKRAITNPDGDFVQIPAFVASDSPTINISDDINKIKNGTFLDEDLRPTKNLTPGAAAVDDDDEELDTVDTKMEKVFMIGSIVAAVILVMVIICIVAWFLSNKVGDDKNSNTNPGTGVEASVTPDPGVTIAPTSGAATEATYTVPYVVGLLQADAEATIKAKDPDAYITYSEDYSDEYDTGEVMKQYPESGNERVMGGSVILTISSGKQSFPVPNVYGLTEAQATTKLKEKKLVIDTNYVNDDKIEAGKVIDTLPERDTLVTAGTTITVNISQGPVNNKVPVPNLLGMTESEANNALTALGLVKGTVDQNYSDIYPEGQVCSQSTSVGVSVNKGSSINITISQGPSSGNGSTDATYSGQVTIDINPFDYLETGESAEVILEMEQDGEVTQIYQNDSASASDFPLTVPVGSPSGSTGTVRMYVGGDLFIVPGETQAATWSIQFTED
ncbi:MAG TPA: Stk1 family PASTA domain-containing Ser/Thr kinase [Mobilitalea sp.]|nr:Stk1 family PASTA domain-containing Ser/Thr kinase [Mobilitalea sp.]